MQARATSTATKLAALRRKHTAGPGPGGSGRTAGAGSQGRAGGAGSVEQERIEADGVDQVVAADELHDEGQAGWEVDGVDQAAGAGDGEQVPGGGLAEDDLERQERRTRKRASADEDQRPLGPTVGQTPAPAAQEERRPPGPSHQAGHGEPPVSRYASQVRAVVCTHEPTSETSWPKK